MKIYKGVEQGPIYLLLPQSQVSEVKMNDELGLHFKLSI